ncbi:unnamed protein product [Moneuplotes crassus]|uniref:Uncharacterized protein n=1 Tax=Euplotes crassus TaxID=5936 RepID=A0AAD1U8W6_EUPCR|nr:unnamed protein product [Moneuplotes crassus]
MSEGLVGQKCNFHKLLRFKIVKTRSQERVPSTKSREKKDSFSEIRNQFFSTFGGSSTDNTQKRFPYVDKKDIFEYQSGLQAHKNFLRMISKKLKFKKNSSSSPVMTDTKTKEKVEQFLTSKDPKPSQNMQREVNASEIYKQENHNESVAKIRKRLHKKYKLAPLFANSTFYIKDECPIKTVEIKRRIEPYDSEDNSTRELGINTVDQNISPESNKIVYRKRKKNLLQARANNRSHFKKLSSKGHFRKGYSRMILPNSCDKKSYTKIFSSFASTRNSAPSTRSIDHSNIDIKEKKDISAILPEECVNSHLLPENSDDCDSKKNLFIKISDQEKQEDKNLNPHNCSIRFTSLPASKSPKYYQNAKTPPSNPPHNLQICGTKSHFHPSKRPTFIPILGLHPKSPSRQTFCSLQKPLMHITRAQVRKTQNPNKTQYKKRPKTEQFHYFNVKVKINKHKTFH